MSSLRIISDDEIIEALCSGRPLIDVRAPIEYEQGTLPNAVNLPLLDDEQRAAVGTVYKAHGSLQAIELGRTLISGAVKARRLETWCAFLRDHPDAIVFCFRGGLRSQLVQGVLAENGHLIPIIEGGFKRVRGLLTRKLSTGVRDRPLRVLSGLTGSGKTEVLRNMAASVSLPFLDLEHRAHHRGSSFGFTRFAQPAPVLFENNLALDWLMLERTGSPGPIWIEDESRLIGRLTVPGDLFDAMSRASVDVIVRPREERAVRLTAEYLVETFGLADGVPPLDWSDAAVRIEESLHKIRARLGGARHRDVLSLFRDASVSFVKTGAFADHWPWVEAILEYYYDPVYGRHLDRISDRIEFTGSTEDWITHATAPV